MELEDEKDTENVLKFDANKNIYHFVEHPLKQTKKERETRKKIEEVVVDEGKLKVNDNVSLKRKREDDEDNVTGY